MNSKLTSSCRLILTLICICANVVGCNKGERTFPDRPILMICPWAAGGGSDRVARQIAVGLERELGVPVNVINATGASGVTGHTRGALARPDGYTITLATAELNMLHWRGLTPVTHNDFGNGVLVNKDPAAIFVRKDSEWDSLERLTKALMSGETRIQASGTALGGIWHVSVALWLDALGLGLDSVRWISIEGATPSLQELMAGGLDFVSCSLPEARSLLEAGEIVALGVMAEARLKEFPDIPTFREQGVDLSLGTWRGVLLPAGVPIERQEVLISALERVVLDDEFRIYMRRSGFNWEFDSGYSFQSSLAQIDQKFGSVFQSEQFSGLGDDIIGAHAFPKLLAVILLIVIVLLLRNRQLGEKDSTEPYTRKALTRIMVMLGCVLFYLLFAESIGFIITSTLIIITLFLVFKIRVLSAIPIGIGVVVVVYHSFAIALRVPLPRGILGW